MIMEQNKFSPKIVISNEDFIKKGYHIGNITEIIESVDELKRLKNIFIEKNKNNKDYFSYRYEYTNFTPLNYSHSITPDKIAERKKLIEDNGYKTIQKWYEYRNGTQSEFRDLMKYINDSVDIFVPKIYPELEVGMDYNSSITLYENGDFIEPHVDHANPVRFCVILLYLSDEENYNDGGGELLVGVDGDNELVKPLFGTYVILDFQKNSVLHAVEPVKNNFQRWTYINFIQIKDESYNKFNLQ